MGGVRGARPRVGTRGWNSDGLSGVIGRHKSPLLACTALSVFAVAGMLSPMSVRDAAAVDECGTAATVNAGEAQVVTCGNITDVNSGVTYQDANIQDGRLFDITFSNSQVNSGGVLLQTTTNDNPFKVTIQDISGPDPKFVNTTGGGSDAALHVTTSGNNSYITVDFNAGTADGTGTSPGSRPGIQLTTNGTNADINLTTAAGTSASSSRTDGIRLATTKGSDITAVINGTTTGAGGAAGLSGQVTGGSGESALTVNGTSTGGLYGVVSRATSGNATSTVNGTATGNAGSGTVGAGTGAAAFTTGGGMASVIVGKAGTSSGTLYGASAIATGAGHASIVVGSMDAGSAGIVKQTEATAGVAPILPTGALATSVNGDATITAYNGSTVTQVGSTQYIPAINIPPFISTPEFPQVKGIGMLALSTGSGKATATANGTVNATGIGVAAIANSNDATTNIGGTVKVGGGDGVSPLEVLSLGAFDLTVGAAAVSTTGAANLNIHGGNINGLNVADATPDIGGMAIVLAGSKNATIDVGAKDKLASTIYANDVGLLALNSGDGNAKIDIDFVDKNNNHNVVNSGGIGIMAVAVGGGDADVEARNSEIKSDWTGIVAGGKKVYVDANNVTSKYGSGISAIGGEVDVDVHGAVKGAGGLLTATVTGVSTDAFKLKVVEDASLTNNGGKSGDAVNIVSGKGIEVVNDGTIEGNMNLFSLKGDNKIINNSNNSWNYSGFTTVTSADGYNTLENNGTATAGPFSLTSFLAKHDNKIDNNATGTFNSFGLNGMLFIDGGTSTFNNAGTFNVRGLTAMIGLDDINNSGVTNMRDGHAFDGIITTGNFNGSGNSTLRFDAQLTPGGYADLLVVGGDVNGVTTLDIEDLVGGPGEYISNDDAILFALVGGDTDSSNFTTNGGISKGFFTYDAYLRETPQEWINFLGMDEWVIASTENNRSFELPVISYGAQQMWQTSTGAWSDRTADLRAAFGGTGFGGGGADAVVEPMEPAVASGSITPGVWGRMYGATQSRDFSNTVAPPIGLDGFDTTFDNNFEQNIYGVMAGIDFGKESVTDRGGQAWLFGIYGGYSGSNLSFDNSDTDVDYTAGSIGAYVTYLNGGLFVDATIKADFGKMDYSSGGDSGSADFTSVGGVIDTGYRMTMASGFYIEPKATLAYVNTSFDNLQVFGTDVAFNDGDSLRGRLGARVGSSIDRSGTLIEPYVEASVWNEFDGDYAATFFSNSTGFVPGFDAEGVYGEVALGASFLNAGNGWSGFGRGAVQFGADSALGLTGNLGVRKAW
ncbi:MAG: autotransporter domain-containing protein [Mesorhizobium sp.]|nr:autotransporter domain-containing protein [Mesorhizobium sp.]MBL8576305.1 autotransporter domain-containing protein [Mesorhizobium sp.]